MELNSLNSKMRHIDGKEYRIYSRISREILDKIWHIFLKFDLHAGPKFGTSKHNIFPYLCVLGTSMPFNRKIKNSDFGHFSTYFSNSTYTRVYTVIEYFWNFSKLGSLDKSKNWLKPFLGWVCQNASYAIIWQKI